MCFEAVVTGQLRSTKYTACQTHATICDTIYDSLQARRKEIDIGGWGLRAKRAAMGIRENFLRPLDRWETPCCPNSTIQMMNK